METLLSQFCGDFERIVRPLLAPLGSSSQALNESPDEIPGKEILPTLLDLDHQLQVLVEKVASQQAYVLIFGPLKSGKSTLMNAFAAAYVSEVTSLPAYPCMVYVSHAPSREFALTRYNGRVDVLTDPTALRVEINRAHGELAENIRRVEARGEQFDPALHFPAAIRRIDVRVPAGELERSGAVLVDTPGLYSRMKFGYDRMTREFRNSAACGIFVVKSDNLFLEQVFEEFNSLLELFSRVFLLVNLDSSKRDLRPDGSLVPSLEQSDPARIIEAFQNLAMSAPLKAAAEKGRLRIYPVDLLVAASQRLKGGDGREASVGKPGADQNLGTFDAFNRDLTEYLNSTDYLVAFLGDSLRQARSLMRELADLCRHESIRTLARTVEELDRDRQTAVREQAALQRLEAFDWQAQLKVLSDELAGGNRRSAQSVESKTVLAVDGALDAWLQDDTSLQNLLDDRLTPLFAGYQEELALLLHRALGERVHEGAAGLSLPASVRQDLATVGIDLGAIGRASLDSIRPESAVEPVEVFLRSVDVPVRKTFWDWILFRSRNQVCRRLFGPPDRPSLRIPRAVKAKRLGDVARRAMGKSLDEFNGSYFHETAERLSQRVLEGYSLAVESAIPEGLAERSQEVGGRIESLKARLRDYQRVLNHLLELQAGVQRATSAVAKLSERYGRTDPKKLILPAKAPPKGSTGVKPQPVSPPAKDVAAKKP